MKENKASLEDRGRLGGTDEDRFLRNRDTGIEEKEPVSDKVEGMSKLGECHVESLRQEC